MTFTSSDISSLATALSRWELAEYCSAALVAVGCVGEYVANFTNWLTGGVREHKERLEKRSTLLLISALSLELICLVRTNALSGALIGSLNEEAGEADNKAKVALTHAGTALARSGVAEDASQRALDESGNATASASKASVLAEGARREADSFEKDIASAKTQATDAESHLGEALRRAADATAELNRLKTPRSLTNIPELVSTLEAFKDTEYTFSAVFQDEESINLLRVIDKALQDAGWKRAKQSGGFPAINVFGRDVDFSVSVSLSTGLKISVDAPESLTTLQALPRNELPSPLKAAVALNQILFANLSPPQYGIHQIDVQSGTSGVIRIAVGKKP
jgi:hypothetical protein